MRLSYLLLAFVAGCGGKTGSPSSTEASQSAQQAGDKDKEKTSSDTTSTGGSSNLSSTSGNVPDCVYVTGSGSSGGDGNGAISCMTQHEYERTSGDKQVTCECHGQVGGGWQHGTCTCGSLTFEADCTNACTGASAAAFERCGVPAPPSGGGGSSGSNSSSGGPGGGSSSSSSSSSSSGGG